MHSNSYLKIVSFGLALAGPSLTAAASLPVSARAALDIVDCPGDKEPNEADCEALTGPWEDQFTETLCTNDPLLKGGNNCVYFTHGNCITTHCFMNIDDPGDYCFNYGRWQVDWTIGDNQCVKKFNAGAKVFDNYGPDFSTFYNNLGSANNIALGGDSDNTIRYGAYSSNTTFLRTKIPLSQYPAYSSEAKESVQRRWQPSDDSYRVLQQATNVEMQGHRYQIGGKYPAGTTRTIEHSESKEESTTISTSVSAGFEDIISASISTDVTTGHTITSGVDMTINYDCKQGESGILYWYPIYDYWYGVSEPSGDVLEVWVPLDHSTGNYRVECLG